MIDETIRLFRELPDEINGFKADYDRHAGSIYWYNGDKILYATPNYTDKGFMPVEYHDYKSETENYLTIPLELSNKEHYLKVVEVLLELW